MSSEAIPDARALNEAFDHDIYSSAGKPLKFGSLFYDCDVYPAEKRILVIFIRHFFCGNCQEYVRRLSSPDSPLHPAHKPTSTTSATNFSKPATRTLPTIIIIGPGQPSLISSYKSLTQCPFDIYADPSTRLYSALGMHRTLSMGSKSPGYIEHSLLTGAVKSAWQIVRRVGSGDAMAGGNWDVNGGEYLFTRSAPRSRSGSCSTSRSRSCSRSANSQASTRLRWEVSWCHRMANSRDHAELADLTHRTCFSNLSSATEDSSRASSPAPLKSILVSSDKAHPGPVSRSYSRECSGSCPGPEVLKSRPEVPADPSHSRSHSRSDSKSKTRRPRSRSTSVGSRKTAKQNHNRVWSNISSAEASRSESATSTTAVQGGVTNAVSEVDDTEVKPRKSLSASMANALGIRAMLNRSKSVASPSVSRPGDASTATKSVRPPTKRSRTISGPITLLRTMSKRKRPTDGTLTKHSDVVPHDRSRASSLSKQPQKHRPSLSLTRKSSGAGKMDQNGVMFVNGIEFVNVISVRARVDSKEEEQRRETSRERTDSGLGMSVEKGGIGVQDRTTLPPLPLPMSVPERGMRQYPSLTALLEVGVVH